MERPGPHPRFGPFGFVQLQGNLSHKLPLRQRHGSYVARNLTVGVLLWDRRASVTGGNGWLRRCHWRRSVARCFPDQFHSAAHAKLRQQRRNVKFYRALGKVQRRGDLFISQAAHHPAKYFFFAAEYLFSHSPVWPPPSPLLALSHFAPDR